MGPQKTVPARIEVRIGQTVHFKGGALILAEIRKGIPIWRRPDDQAPPMTLKQERRRRRAS
jgi:hypothetical protein